MNRIVVVAASLIFAALLAGPAVADDPAEQSTPAVSASPGVSPLTVGAPITIKKPVKIAQLAEKPERFVGKTVLLRGKVKEVCQGMGCWVRVEDAKGVSFLAKSLDESVLLPKDCAGRIISVQGVVTLLEPKAHDHEDAAADHECPQPTFLVSTQGAALE